jgi:Protein of unknown function DUF262
MSTSAPAYQTEPQIQFLYQLIDEIAEGHFQIPRFQRPDVWTDDQRLELFRSIRAGTPIGSIMVWRTNTLEMRCYAQLGPYVLKEPSDGTRTYIIDGHQRLATLFGALYTPPKQSELPEYIAYYDLSRNDFLFASASEQPNPAWMPLRYALDIAQLIPFQRSLGGLADAETLIKNADMLSGAFKRYKIPVLPIVTNDLDQVTKTFQRVNSQGTVMSEVHMVAALTWSDKFDLNERISRWKEQWLAPEGWGDLDDKVVLYACKAALGFDVYDTDVDAVSHALRQQPGALENAARSLVDAASFLRTNCGIRSPRVLPYESHLVPLAEAIRRKPGRHDGADRDTLIRWFWLLSYSGTRAGLPKLLQTLEHMYAASSVSPPIPVKLPGSLPALPKRFDFRSARCKTLALRLADLAGDSGVDWLAREGADAMPHFILNPAIVPPKWSPNPANRILTDPRSADQVRSEIIAACGAGREGRPESQAVLIRHAISGEAAAALAENNWDDFYRLRLLALENLEMSFVHGLGLASNSLTLIVLRLQAHGELINLEAARDALKAKVSPPADFESMARQLLSSITSSGYVINNETLTFITNQYSKSWSIHDVEAAIAIFREFLRRTD